MRKIYVVSGAKLRYYQNELLKDGTVSFGTRVLPFYSACLPSNVQEEILEIACYNALHVQQFSLLNESFKDPATLRKLIDFYYELQCYSIPIDALPNESQREFELKRAFLCLSQILPDLSVPNESLYYDSEGLSHAQVAFLTRHSAQPLPVPETPLTSLQVFEALNFRQELEGSVQYLLENRIDTATLAIPNYDSSLPFVESVFERYGMKMKLQNHSFDLLKHQMTAWIDYLVSPSIEAFITLLSGQALPLKSCFRVRQYIEHYRLGLTEILEPFNYALPTDNGLVREIVDLQDSIQEDVTTFQELLTTLNAQSFEAALLTVLELLANRYGQDARPLVQYIQNIYTYVSLDIIPLMKHHIASLSNNPKTDYGIQVCDVDSFSHDASTPLIILGLTSKVYPNLKSRTGILDERYCSTIQGFPSLEKRNAFILNQKRSLFRKSQQLIASYPHATYEGKSLEVAYDLEVLMKRYDVRPQPWKLIEPLRGESHPLKLNPEIAQQLYAPSGSISGSVTSFEQYVNNPLDHFIRFGLRYQQPPTYELDRRLYGILNHSFFENTLQGATDSLWDEYVPYLPKKNDFFDVENALNTENLSYHLHVIKEAQKTTSFVPRVFEHRFKDVTLFQGIRFSGVIDRIDFSDTHLMIVDYKSSAMRITQEGVLNGTQLQLLTYALIARATYNLPVQGAFYYGLNQPSLEPLTLGYSKSKGIKTPEPYTAIDLHKESAYTGWFFEEPNGQFDTHEYYSGLMCRKKDDTLYIHGKPYDIERVKEYLVVLYQDIREAMLGGILDVNNFKFPRVQEFSFKQGADDDDTI